MSYPLVLQALVIEDDAGTKEAYQGIFETIAAEAEGLPFRAAPPCFAFSYQQAVEYLSSSRIFHVVILDLRLPERLGLPEVEDEELGLKLLTNCLERDRFPIPALLVISGHIGSTEQARMQDTLRQGFFYGRQFAKGNLALLQGEIRAACTEALRYCSAGVHLRDGEGGQYPTITPRDEDLLRRSALQQHSGIGVDLTWWSARRFGETNIETGGSSWTKVLMGRYLLGGGDGASRPKFFKLLPGAWSAPVIDSALRVEHKLTHIKVTSTVAAKSSALIVTEKVGALEERSRPLEELFSRILPEQVPVVAKQIATQVEQLGDLLPNSKPFKRLLWSGHDHALLTEQWARHGSDVKTLAAVDPDPIALYSALATSEETVMFNERALVHGDLHIRNIALDLIGDRAEAYIFDPGVTRRNVAGQDLAVLEVSVLLHQKLDFESLLQICGSLYGSSNLIDDSASADAVDSMPGRIVQFVRGLRRVADGWNQPSIYALMVLDFALIQVGGLGQGSSGNMITDPRSAVYLLAVVAAWYRKLRS